METLSRTRAIGGSLVVTIPKEVVLEESLCEGELVKLGIEKVRKDFFGVLKGVGSFEDEDKLKGQFEA